LAANQEVNIFAQLGAPKPCNIPFMAHNAQKRGKEALNPNKIFTTPVAMSPPPSITAGESMSPTTPLTNLLQP
jgi:hypothetical protein